MPRILISNDDGIDALGLKLLAKSISRLGDVTIVAPDRQRSTSSHSITLHRPLRIERKWKDAYIVDGTPSDCVYIGVNFIMKDSPPNLVVSGINHGANLGDDISYSGTVAAAMEGTILGVKAIAASLVGKRSARRDFEDGAEFVTRLAESVLKRGMPEGTFLNVNIPQGYASVAKGFKPSIMGRRFYDRLVKEKTDPRGDKYYWIGGNPNGYRHLKGSDCDAINSGKISVTPIKLDMTDVAFLKKMKGWKI